MFLDRRRRRAVLLATGIVCSTISAGCLSSSLARRAADATSEPTSAAALVSAEKRDLQARTQPGRTDSSVRSASVQAADAALAGETAATPFMIAPGPLSPAPAGAFPLELQAVPSESAGKAVPGGAGPRTGTPSTAQPPPPTNTPLIDAHIQRVADITRQQREAIASSPSPDETEVPKRAFVPSLISGSQSLVAETGAPERLLTNNNDVVPLPRRLSRSVDDETVIRNARFLDSTPKPKADEHLARREPRITGSDDDTLDGKAHLKKAEADSARREPRSPGRPSFGAETASKGQETKAPLAPKAAEGSLSPASPTGPGAKDHKDIAAADYRASNPAPGGESTAAATVRESSPAPRGGSLGISELRLCRSISGFGSFEPLANERVKVGQSLLVYCELTGLEYEKREAGFASRISSRVELKRASGGPVIWEQELGNAEDKCRRQRHDFYVSCSVDLPKTLPPGSYRLRMLPTDLVAGSSTSADIPLEITP